MRTIDFGCFCQWEACQINTDFGTFGKYIIDMTKDYPPVDFLLKYNGVGCIPQGELQAITGKMKAGKSFACLCVEVAMLNGKFMGFEAQKDNIRILHIDTEQSPGNIINKIGTAHSLCGWPIRANNERLRILSLCECPFHERLEKIIEAIYSFAPDFVFIDGIRDLCRDFNDISESMDVVNTLLTVAREQHVGIMCVLHENKNDTNMRGHLGTELGNKSSEIFKVSQDASGVITVEQTVCRNEYIDKWAFTINKGVPEQHEVSQGNKVRQRRDEALQIIFRNKTSYIHTDLVNEFMPLYGCKERCAKGHIGDALKEGMLCKKDDLYYYVFPPDEDDLF